jgi:hypothetical protein
MSNPISSIRWRLFPFIAFSFSIGAWMVISSFIHSKYGFYFHGVRMNTLLVGAAVMASIAILILCLWVGRKIHYKLWQKTFIWMTYCICLFNMFYTGTLFAEARYHAIDRERLKTTMHRMKDWAMAWETYYVAQETYVPQEQQVSPVCWGNISGEHIIRMLKKGNVDSGLIDKLYLKDAWDHDFQFCVFETGPSQEYFIRSAGKDGSWDAIRYLMWFYDENQFDADVVMGNGQFYRWMEARAMVPYPDYAPHKVKDRDVVPRFPDHR